MSKQTFEFTIREIVLESGKTELLCMNNQQYAGYLRRKGQRKKIISNKKLFVVTLSLKNLTNK